MGDRFEGFMLVLKIKEETTNQQVQAPSIKQNSQENGFFFTASRKIQNNTKQKNTGPKTP